MNSKRILLVDDDADQRLSVRLPLEAAGYAVFEAANFDQGLSAVKQLKPDLIVLDVMMDTTTAGFQFALSLHSPDPDSEFKAFKKTPIIMLTARVEEADQVAGLELGADDYIAKPFSPRQLIARIKAELRRAGAPSPGIITSGVLTLDPIRHDVQRAGSGSVNLTPLEFRLLHVLIQNRGQVLPVEDQRDRYRRWIPGNDERHANLGGWVGREGDNLGRVAAAGDVVEVVRHAGVPHEPDLGRSLDLLQSAAVQGCIWAHVKRVTNHSAFDRPVAFPLSSEDDADVFVPDRRAAPNRVGNDLRGDVTVGRQGLPPPQAAGRDAVRQRAQVVDREEERDPGERLQATTAKCSGDDAHAKQGALLRLRGLNLEDARLRLNIYRMFGSLHA